MALEGISRHPDLWYDDGTVILIAEKTGFRVYRGLLAKHSEVFRDMFTVPQPTTPTINDAYEGCPVVHLVDDTADDIAEVLKILHNGHQSFYSTSHNESMEISFTTVAAALRIGTKYEFSMLREAALWRVSMCFPAEVEILQGHIAEQNWSDDSDGPCCCSISSQWSTSLAVFHLARRLDLAEVLPAALYRCVTEHPLSDIFSVVATTNTEYKYPYPLSLEDFKMCLTAHEYLAGRVRSIQRSISSSKTTWDCESPNHCASAAKTVALELQEQYSTTGCDALRRMRSWLLHFERGVNYGWVDESVLPSNVLCRACEAGKLVIIEEYQQETWRYLQKELCAPKGLDSEEKSTEFGKTV